MKLKMIGGKWVASIKTTNGNVYVARDTVSEAMTAAAKLKARDA